MPTPYSDWRGELLSSCASCASADFDSAPDEDIDSEDAISRISELMMQEIITLQEEGIIQDLARDFIARLTGRVNEKSGRLELVVAAIEVFHRQHGRLPDIANDADYQTLWRYQTRTPAVVKVN